MRMAEWGVGEKRRGKHNLINKSGNPSKMHFIKYLKKKNIRKRGICDVSVYKIIDWY